VENSTFEAVVSFNAKEKLKIKKAQSHEAGKKADNKKETLRYPSHDELRAEAEEAKPQVYLTVYDESGAPIRRVEGETGEGFHRTTWDLRYPTVSEVEEVTPGEGFPPAAAQGPLVLPGKYSVRVFKKVDGAVTELGAGQSFNVVADGTAGMAEADRAAREEFNRKVARLYRAVSGSINAANDLQSRIKATHK